MDSCLIFNYVHISNFFSDFFLVKNFHHSYFFSGKSFLMCQDFLTADYLITSFATLLERVYIYNLYRKNTIRDAGSTALYTAVTVINTVVTRLEICQKNYTTENFRVKNLHRKHVIFDIC